MLHSKVIGCLLGVCVLAMLAKQTEGFLSFISPSDMRRMMEQEKVKAGKKSVDLEPRSEEREFGKLASTEWNVKDDAVQEPLEIGVRLTHQRLNKLAPALGEILQEMLEEGQQVAE
ncbi:motilin-like [Lepisosteus oculatus]|uniref:motilin-like n=1 Tax=Lepisosteus oculatus TaxID=7918 RepID=UPI0003EADE57